MAPPWTRPQRAMRLRRSPPPSSAAGRGAPRLGALRRRRLGHAARPAHARDGRRASSPRLVRRRAGRAGRRRAARASTGRRASPRASPRSASSPGPASRSGGRSPATAPGTRSRRASSCSPSASSASPPRVLPGPAAALARARSLAGALGAVLAWALLGKAIPALGPDDAGRVARLKGSIGYWNALALLADAALGLGLWLARRGRADALRPAGRRAARSTRRRS